MSVRALLVAFATLGAAFTAQAQSVTTAPVGAVSKAIPVGLTSVGISLLNPDLVVANCTANTASVLTLSGVTSVGSLLTSGIPYYVEAVSGDLEGDRFEVDVAATITANNGTVVLNTSSANNTLALASGNAVGSQFALRRHVTLAQVQSFFSSPLVGSNIASQADQVLFFNSASGAFTAYFLRADLVTWRQVGSTANANNTVVPPGVGLFVQKVGGPNQLVAVGAVRTNDFAMPQVVGNNLAAPAYPVDFSPAKLGGTLANGWTGNNVASNADQILVYNPASGAFTAYFLRADGVTWRQVGSTTSVTTTDLFAADSAFLVNRKTADNDYILNSPISL